MEKVGHYNKGGIQPSEYIEANDLNFNEGNVVKYVTRYPFKNGAQDLCKAVDYSLFLLREYYGLDDDTIRRVREILRPYNSPSLQMVRECKRMK